jgi:hypothetical protein
MATIYQGLFDRTTVGRKLPTVTVQVERGRIRFFAQVLGLEDPVHSQLQAAHDRGFPDIVAPLSFFTVIDAMAADELRQAGEQSAADLIGCDFRYLLHGDESYDYRGPIFAGDAVQLSTRIADFYDKKGGAMEFAVIESAVEHAERGVLLIARRTLLHRLG